MLLDEQRNVRNIHGLLPLTLNQILEWADAHHKRTGSWPTRSSSCLDEQPGENWSAIDASLRVGLRGFPGGSSLAKLLAKHRGVRNVRELPALTEQQILAWADEHHSRTGEWPKAKSGSVHGAPGEKWANIEAALSQGGRRLAGGSSLAELLAVHDRKTNKSRLPALTESQILRWADSHRKRTGKWPSSVSGVVDGADGQTWLAIDRKSVV